MLKFTRPIYKLVTLPPTEEGGSPVEVMAPHTVQSIRFDSDGAVCFTVQPWHDGVPVGEDGGYRTDPPTQAWLDEAIHQALVGNGFQDTAEG